MRILVLGLALLSLWVARGFVLQILFAMILATAVWPWFRRLNERPKSNGGIVLPLAFTLGIGLLLIVPIVVLSAEAIRDSETVAHWLAQLGRSGIPRPDWISRIPLVSGWLGHWWDRNLSNPAGAAALFGQLDASSVMNRIGSVAATLASVAMFLFVSLLSLFILLRSGVTLSGSAERAAARLLGPFGQTFVARLGDAVRGTVNGTVLTSLGEGVLIGLGYAVTGVPHAISFTVATIIVALFPFGAWLAFSIASVILVLQGNLLSGLALLGFSCAVMLVGDNIVQPAMIGRSIRLPFLWTFVGVFGGVYSFGVIGLFIGPSIMAAFYLAWNEWQAHEQW